jgi:pimeloyl-ACP methyl ester carboxylesterase
MLKVGMGGRRMRRWAGAIVALEFVLGADASALQQAPKGGAGAPAFVEQSCTAVFGTFEHAKPSNARCGTVTVPQNRATPKDPRLVGVVLPVIVLEMPGATGTPLLFLAGGPGESSIEAVQEVFLETSIGQLLMRQRPIIAFDRRGLSSPLGRTSPDLGLLVSGGRSKTPSVITSSIDSAKDASKRLRAQGVELKNFSTPEAIDDIRDVSKSLGFEKLVLFGVSYGTRDALQFMRRHPTMVESAILDGVAPPQTTALFNLDSISASRRAVVRQVTAECAADIACHGEYPNLAATFERLDRVGSPPLRITANLPQAGGWRTVDLDPSSLLSTIGGVAGSEQIRAIIPQLLEDFASGDTLRRPLSPEVVMAAALDSALRLRGGRRMPVVYHVTVCSDIPGGSSERGGRAFCDALGVPFSGPDAITPVVSNTPVLLISSGYDSQTPPSMAAQAARTLSRSHQVNFRMVGHIAFRYPTTMACAAVVISSFMAQPDRDPATSCVDTVRPSFLPRRVDLPLSP